jgi:HD-GYP domain-containing protein (c-di-GMP phosphodiesterase class II)/anti-sigma regulatory factor (Ser/Thr protein kinase)
MKHLNAYTAVLCSMGVAGFLYGLIQFDKSYAFIFGISLFIIIILEILPVRLPSGDKYVSGSLGFLFLLLDGGFSYSAIASVIASYVYFAKGLRTWKVPLTPFLSTAGMYIGSLFASLLIWKATHSLPLILSVVLVASTFEIVNIVLLEFIHKFVFGAKKIFIKIEEQLKETFIPVLISAIVIPKWYSPDGYLVFLYDMLYTLFFFLLILFFSQQFFRQLEARKLTSRAFTNVLESRIALEKSGHGNRVGIICEILLDEWQYPKRKKQDLIQCAIVHDIGKSLLPSYIFRKRGALTISEEKEYNTHSEKGVELLTAIFLNNNITESILYHHENWDGTGFPKGLKGEEIPLEARIIAICNELDHLLVKYNDDETVMELLEEKSGTLLDPKLVGVLTIETITHVREELSDLLEIPIYEKQEQEQEVKGEKENQLSAHYEAKSHIGESLVVTWENGVYYHTESLPFDANLLDELVTVVKKRQATLSETIQEGEFYWEVHGYPMNLDKIFLFVHDMSSMIAYRERLETKILESYENVIHTLSDGKISFYADIETIEQFLGQLQDQMKITTTSDIPKSRAFLDKYIKESDLELQPMKILLAVSEATTNLLKHATGGEIFVYKTKEKLQILISDKGSGIPLHEIPKTILVSGYSTKKSLGKGFQLMTGFSNGVHVHTSSKGTCIVLDFLYRTEEESVKEKTIS